MASAWKYSRDGRENGPVSSAQLKQLAASGRLLPADLVCKEGMAGWVPASQLKGLFPEATSSATTAATPPPISSPIQTAPSPVPQWFYTKGEQQHGPVAIEQLSQLAAKGALDPFDLVWREGTAEWTEASMVEPLAAAWSRKAEPVSVMPPPRPAGPPSQPTSSPAMPMASGGGRATGQDTLKALRSLGGKAKSLAREAAAGAKKAHAAVPNRIKIGKIAVPKLAIYGAVALVLIVSGWFVFGHRDRHGATSGEDLISPRAEKKSLWDDPAAAAKALHMPSKSDGGTDSNGPTGQPGNRQTAQMTTDQFTKTVAKLVGQETWNIMIGSSIPEGYFLHVIRSDRIPYDRWEAAVGKPDQVHDAGDWTNQEWVYRLSDGVATLRIMDFRMVSSGGNEIIVNGPGIVVGPRPVHMSGEISYYKQNGEHDGIFSPR